MSDSSKQERIGFIGAGLMGRSMALHLLRAAHPLTVFVHRKRDGIDELVAQGARETNSLLTIAETSDVVVMCVSNADTVQAVIEEILPGLRRGQLVIDATTSHPRTTRQVAGALAEKGVRYADAPLTGGPAEAAAGRLASLVGCSDEDFEQVRRIVSCYSKVAYRIGAVGAGHQAKLLNNFVSLGTAVLLAEAYRRARDGGVDWKALHSVMEAGAARSGTLEKMIKPALDGDFDGSRFSLTNALKDYRYFCELAEESPRGPSPLANRICETLQEAVDAGYGDRYVSALLDPEYDALLK
ncbi:MAG: NAD(P)-dependent oxidoreductase, partial [Candidatus Accumulibacter sp.]|nr:NAD(P)-dependent oxidoreductase [Accumulibacter sp.]